jgi:hypothetical protein
MAAENFLPFSVLFNRHDGERSQCFLNATGKEPDAVTACVWPTNTHNTDVISISALDELLYGEV